LNLTGDVASERPRRPPHGAGWASRLTETRTWTGAAGCPGRIPHDLRRTAIRNFVRSGTSENVAMRLSGHQTRSVFDRYDIVSGEDLREAARKLNIAAGR